MKTKPKKKTRQPVSFTIPRSQWLRGTGQGTLRDRDSRKRCCLGVIAGQLGYPARCLTGRDTPQDLDDMGPFCKIGLVRHNKDSKTAEKMMMVNDDNHLTDPERERRLQKLASRLKIKLTFTDKVAK